MAQEYQNAFETFTYRLSLYFHLQAMDPARRAKFDELKTDKKLNIPQGRWDPDTMPTIVPGTPPAPDTFIIKGADGQDISVEMDQAQWEELYTIFANVFRSFDANRYDLSKKTLEEILPQYYNANRTIGLFSAPEIPISAQTHLTKLADFLNNPIHAANMKRILNEHLAGDAAYADFITNLRNPGAAGAEFSTKLRSVLYTLQTAAQNASYYDVGINPFGGTAEATRIYNLASDITQELANTPVNAGQLARFKTEFARPNGLLQKLYANGRTFAADFAKRGGGRITEIINKAKEENDYEKGDNAIAGKDTDVRTGLEKIKKDFDDLIDPSIGKLTSRHAREIYDHADSSSIVESIIKEKIKPTDGLEGFLKKAEDVQKRLQKSHPGAVANFKWLKERLDEVKEEIPYAFKGALRTGKQLNAVAKNLIHKAAKSGDKGKCLVALEVLSVIRYDNFSSSIRDEVFKEDFNTFKGTEFEKKMPEVAKGLAMTFKAASRVVFELANFGKNQINKSGLLFNTEDLKTGYNKAEVFNAGQNALLTAADNAEFERLITGAAAWTTAQAETEKNTAEATLTAAEAALTTARNNVTAQQTLIGGPAVPPDPATGQHLAIETARAALGAAPSKRDLDNQVLTANNNRTAIVQELQTLRDRRDFLNAAVAGGAVLNTEETMELAGLPAKITDAHARSTTERNARNAAQAALGALTPAQIALESEEVALETMQAQLVTLQGIEQTAGQARDVAKSDLEIKEQIFKLKEKPSKAAKEELSDIHEMMQYWNYRNNSGERMQRNDLNILTGKDAHKKKQAEYDAKNKVGDDKLILFKQYMAKKVAGF